MGMNCVMKKTLKKKDQHDADDRQQTAGGRFSADLDLAQQPHQRLSDERNDKCDNDIDKNAAKIPAQGGNDGERAKFDQPSGKPVHISFSFHDTKLQNLDKKLAETKKSLIFANELMGY